MVTWSLVVLLANCAAPLLAADELFLTETNAFPGKLVVCRDGRTIDGVHRRPVAADPAYPNAVMRASQVALDVDGKIYFCSGLDNYVMHYVPGGHEIAVLEAEGQIRDVACTEEPQVVYYSVLDTPQNGMPLGDGRIYRRHLGEGAPRLMTTVRQSDVGGNWWGAFTVLDGVIHLATFEPDSRIFKWTGDRPVPVATATHFQITGLARPNASEFLFTTDSGKVYRTRDFSTCEAVAATDIQLRDVAIRPFAGAVRPSSPRL